MFVLSYHNYVLNFHFDSTGCGLKWLSAYNIVRNESQLLVSTTCVAVKEIVTVTDFENIVKLTQKIMNSVKFKWRVYLLSNMWHYVDGTEVKPDIYDHLPYSPDPHPVTIISSVISKTGFSVNILRKVRNWKSQCKTDQNLKRWKLSKRFEEAITKERNVQSLNLLAVSVCNKLGNNLVLTLV